VPWVKEDPTVAHRLANTLYLLGPMRPLLPLLILMLTICSSGISSAIAFTVERDDDCCVDSAEDGARDPLSSGDRDPCPPFCHGCACSPAFSVPVAIAFAGVVRVVERYKTIRGFSQLPIGPDREGAFHPPRRSA
jgi:hypothetical protein